MLSSTVLIMGKRTHLKRRNKIKIRERRPIEKSAGMENMENRLKKREGKCLARNPGTQNI
jgi:hypothetical protein